MTILPFKDYEQKKRDFLIKSKCDWFVDTSSMDEYGRYVKTYVCENGRFMTEVCRPITKQVEVETMGCKALVNVKLLEQELFSCDFGSVFHYEQF